MLGNKGGVVGEGVQVSTWGLVWLIVCEKLFVVGDRTYLRAGELGGGGFCDGFLVMAFLKKQKAQKATVGEGSAAATLVNDGLSE
jgi:hypothetical protein